MLQAPYSPLRYQGSVNTRSRLQCALELQGGVSRIGVQDIISHMVTPPVDLTFSYKPRYYHNSTSPGPRDTPLSFDKTALTADDDIDVTLAIGQLSGSASLELTGASRYEHPVGTPAGGKKGMSIGEIEKLIPYTDKIGWVYNWEFDLDVNTLPPNMQYIPQLWNVNGKDTASWAPLARASIQRGNKVLFGFNEPQEDMCGFGQACMTAVEAAQAWKQYMEPLKTEFPDIALVSPAITSDVEGKGKAWLAEFFRLCPALECRVDGINIHWYGGAHEVGAFMDFVNSCYAQFQRPVWVTEFAIYEDSPASVAEKQAFIRNAVGFLESNANVAGYAYFWVHSTTKLKEGSTTEYELNDLGKAYVGL